MAGIDALLAGGTDSVALRDGARHVTYAGLAERVGAVADELAGCECRVLGLMADNGIDWIVADLAAMATGIAVVPVPPYFTTEQICHLVTSAGIDTLAVDALPVRRYEALQCVTPLARRIGGLGLLRVGSDGARRSALHSGTAKVTFTSGSTARPRGVCLSRDTMLDVAGRLADVFADLGVQRHLCVTPLATLLENVAGVYTPLLLGATVDVPSLATLGLYGSSRIDAARFAATIEAARAESLILTPELLRELTSHCTAHPPRERTLKLVAVGGARVADADLDAAAAAGIPAWQGYGLSECGSVVALNRPGAARAGSVGTPLPGITVTCAADGELLVTGQSMLGYLDGPTLETDTVATGDLGRIDDDGFVQVTGRRKNVFITSFGRNVSPEWPEAELLHEPEIAQACVFGEARPENVAVLVPAQADADDTAIDLAVSRVNRRLPDYARIARWLRADAPFSPAAGLATSTGKPRREAIERLYAVRINAATVAPADAPPPHVNHSRETRHELF